MSEYEVEAYFVETPAIAGAFGSRDAALLKRILRDDDGLMARLAPRLSRKSLPDAVGDLIDGREDPGHAAHYTFAVWVMVARLSTGRPDEPRIPPPFVSLYDTTAALDQDGRYPGVLRVLRALNNEIDNTFPHQLRPWGDMPGVAYVDRADLPALADEVAGMRSDLQHGADWTDAIDVPEDLERLLGWLDQARERNTSLCLVMDGDL